MQSLEFYEKNFYEQSKIKLNSLNEKFDYIQYS